MGRKRKHEVPDALKDFALFAGCAKLCNHFESLYASWKQTHEPAINVDKELARAHDFALQRKAEGRPYKAYVRYLGSWMRRQAEWVALGKKAPAFKQPNQVLKFRRD